MFDVNKALLRPLSVLSLMYVLTACGGGGGGGGGSDNGDDNDGGDNPPPANAVIGEVSDNNANPNEVSENAPVGTDVGITALATDSDDLDTVTYALIDTELFTIDLYTGVVTTAQALDFETNSTHTIQVRASSSDGSSSNAPFTIAVIDENDTELGDVSDSDASANSVSEAAPLGSPVGITASVEPTDDDSGQISYSLSDTTVFAIDETTGVVTTAAALDYETSDSYQIEVVVSDEAGRQNTATYTIDVIDNLPPEIAVTFPGAAGYYLGSEISLSGTVADAENDNYSIAVSLGDNQSQAILDPVSEQWRVEDFALGNGTSAEVLVTATDLATQETTTSTIQLTLEPIFVRPESVVLDSANQRAFVMDRSAGAIMSVDLESGVRTVLSGPSHAGPELVTPEAMVLDADNNRLLALESLNDALLAVDLDSGDRALISDRSITSGDVAFRSPKALALDGGRALVLDDFLDAIFAVDLSNGEQTLLHDANSEGPDFDRPVSIVLDGNQALVLDEKLNSLFAVDLASGESRVVSDDATDENHFAGPRNMALDADNNRVFVVDGSELSAPDRVLAVDLTDGTRSLISGNDEHAGLELRIPEGVVMDSNNNRLLVSDIFHRALMSVDLDTGERAAVSLTPIFGSGDSIVGPNAIALEESSGRILLTEEFGDLYAIDSENGDRERFSDLLSAGDDLRTPVAIAAYNSGDEVLVVDRTNQSVVRVDRASGARSIVSDVNDEGPEFQIPVGIALDEANNQAWVIDELVNELFLVDLQDGRREILSNDDNGEATSFGRTEDIVLNSTNDRAFIIDSRVGAVIEVELASGLRRLVSSFDDGNGVDFAFPMGIDIDSESDYLLVADSVLSALLRVDIESGDRELVSSVDIGGGVPFVSAEDVIIDERYNRAFVLDRSYHLMVVDLDTGDRVVISR